MSANGDIYTDANGTVHGPLGVIANPSQGAMTNSKKDSELESTLDEQIDTILDKYWLTATSSTIRSPQRSAHYTATKALKQLIKEESDRRVLEGRVEELVKAFTEVVGDPLVSSRSNFVKKFSHYLQVIRYPQLKAQLSQSGGELLKGDKDGAN